MKELLKLLAKKKFPNKTSQPCGELFSFIKSFGASCDNGQVDVGGISERAIG